MRFAIPIWAANARRWSSGSERSRIEVEARLADRHDPGRLQSSSIASAAGSSKPAALFGCLPTEAKTSSFASAEATASGFESSPSPTVRIRLTPASRAAPISSASAGSQSPRCAWVSTTRRVYGPRLALMKSA